MQLTVQTTPPSVHASHPDQRYFTRQFGERITPKLGGDGLGIRVYRNARFDHTELTFRLGLGELSARLDAAELRLIAAALFSAAVDLETLPAKALAEVVA